MVLGSDLMALAINPDSGRVRVGPRLSYALAASELVTLAGAGRVELQDGILAAVDDEPVADVRAADALERLLRLPRPHSVYDWLRVRGPWRIDAYIAALEEDGAIRLVPMPGGGKRIALVNAGALRTVHDRLPGLYTFPPSQTADELALAALAVAAHATGFGSQRARRRLVRRRLADGPMIGGGAAAGFGAGSSGSRAVEPLLRLCLSAIEGLARGGGTGRSDDQRMGLSETGRWAALASLFPNA